MNVQIYIIWSSLATIHCLPEIVFLTLTMQAAGRGGYWATEPVFDVIFEDMREVNQDIWSNMTHMDLHYGFRKNPKPLTLPVPSFTVRDDNACKQATSLVADYFFQFYFSHVELFSRPLTEQIIIMTTTGNPNLDFCVENDMLRFSN